MRTVYSVSSVMAMIILKMACDASERHVGRRRLHWPGMRAVRDRRATVDMLAGAGACVIPGIGPIGRSAWTG